MTSSLASQLAQGVSLNASRLVDRSRRKPTQSYLFGSREADQHDLDSVHALGVNGFQRLKSVDPAFSEFEDILFSEAAKATDRTLQNTETNIRLDQSISTFLPLLGPYLLETPSGKVIEWLVRRFRINEFNVESVLAVFFPYQDSPHFNKMLTILHIQEQSKFSALLPYLSTSSPFTLSALVDILTKPSNTEFARFVTSLLPRTVKSTSGPHVHRALVAFHAGVLLELMKRSQKRQFGSLEEGTLVWILPAIVDPLRELSKQQLKGAKQALSVEVILSCYILLSALSHTCPLSANALTSILEDVVSCAQVVSTTQVLRTLGSICATQAAVVSSAVSPNVVRTVMKLAHVDEEIKELLKYSGTERFIQPLVCGFLAHVEIETAFKILTSLVTHSDLPRAILVLIANELMIQSVQPNTAHDSADAQGRRRSLLVHLHQRQPAVLQQAAQETLVSPDVNKDAVEQILLSLSVQLPGSLPTKDDDKANLLLATVSGDTTARTAAVRSLNARVAAGDLSSTELDAVRSALLARVQDSQAPVVEALYTYPSVLLPIIRKDDAAYVNDVARVLYSTSSSPSQTLVKAHLSFIVTRFYPAVSHDSEMKAAIFWKIFFPLLLFSKPRRKSAAAVWEIVGASEREGVIQGISHYELLGGCLEAVRWEEGKASTDQGDESYQATETMANINLQIAVKIAENIRSSTSYGLHVERLLAQMQQENSHAKILAFMVCRALILSSTGERQVRLACDTLKVAGIDSLEGMDDFLRGSDNVQVFLHDLSLGTAVVLKPTKRSTMHKLQVAILTTLASIPRPAGPYNWLLGVSTDVAGAELYIMLARSLYRLSNSTSSQPLVSTLIIQGLFGTIGNEALQFLAGIWLTAENYAAFSPAQFAALRHATAYLEAHYSAQRFMDFQLILPALLVTLTHGDRRIREAGLESIAALFRLSQANKPSSIYAFDAIYGPKSADLQYLDWSDFCKYVQALQQARQHLLNDPAYLPILNQQLLASAKLDSKKDATHKQRVLCYILSHVAACPNSAIQSVLLESTRSISSPVKFQTLSPTLAGLGQSAIPAADNKITNLLLAVIDETAAPTLNDNKGEAWATYTAIIRHYLHPGASSAARSTVSHSLKAGLFAKLHSHRKVAVCRLLLEIGQQNPEITTDCKDVLSALLVESAVIIDLLSTLQPSSPESSQRATKRARVESSIHSPEAYAVLTLLAEILGAKSLPGAPELVIALLDTLSKVISDSSVTTADKTYVEQLLLSALENAVGSVSAGGGKSLKTIRLDPLVELIRVSENPQTFNQALLLIAGLAKLVPEAVLQNVMPVFTFMGSNVFHRDDTYSFKVVQKTVDSIVPVMIASLRQSYTGKLDLRIACRPFLRIFTDAFNHVPRHRRISFFTHLVEVLGVNDFLSSICLLLVDKVSNKVVRQNGEDVLSSLSLPLSVFERFSADSQLLALVEMLEETSRLLQSQLQGTQEAKLFLEPVAGDDERSTSSQSPRRQAQAILTFASNALQQMSSAHGGGTESNSALLALLLNIAVTKEDELARASMEKVSIIARGAIIYALKVMRAQDFIVGVVKVLDMGQLAVQRGALEVLSEQMKNISDKVRQDSRASIVKIVESVKKIIISAPETLTVAALDSLKVIASTMSTGEEYVLTSAVPLTIGLVQQRKTTSSALSVLLVLIQKLGPRIIPFFKDIVKECVGVLGESGSQAYADSIDVLHALLNSIPSFWSSGDFLLVVELYLKQDGSEEQQRQTRLSSFVKNLTKRAPSKVLLPTLCDLWTRLSTTQPGAQQLRAYLFVLRRTIQHTDRAVIPEHLRNLFKTFLEIFSLCASSADIREAMESDAISTFVEMVVKMNEPTFKPLFRKLFDWAFTAADTTAARKVGLLHLYVALLDYFKSLMTPYMTFLLQPLVDILRGFRESIDDTALWSAAIQTLTSSCINDEGAFWREDKLSQCLAPVVTQIPVSLTVNSTEPRDALRDCLVALAELIGDSSALKSFNLGILMHTRSEDARVRIYALSCSGALWQAHGGKLIGFAPETATFIAECCEDDNDSVVREAHRLKNAVESVAGRIDV